MIRAHALTRRYGDRWRPPSTATPLTGPIQRLFLRIRAIDQRRPSVWNGVLTTCWVLFAVLDVSSGGWRTVAADPHVPAPLVFTMSAAFSVPLLWRRNHPLAVLLFMAPFSLANVWTGALIQAALLQEIVVFTIAVRLPMRTLAWSGVLIAAPLVITSGRFPEVGGRLLLPHV